MQPSNRLDTEIQTLQEQLSRGVFVDEKERQKATLRLIDLLEQQEQKENGEIIVLEDELHFSTPPQKEGESVGEKFSIS